MKPNQEAIGRSKCPYCGRVNQDNPSDYYHRARCEAGSIREQLAEATDPGVRARLKKRLELAEYVGD